VSVTTQRGATEPADAPTRVVARPERPAYAVAGLVRAVLVRYLAGAFLLLFIVTLVHPRGQPAPQSQPWQYQRETIAVDGSGLLNAYARAALHGTAWLAKASIERQRDVHRLNLLDFLLGPGAAQGVGGWRSAHRLALEVTTQVAIGGLVLYGLVLRPARRRWLLALVLLLVSTLFLTKPQAVLQAAAAPGIAVPNRMLGMVARVAPASEADRHGSAADVEQRMSTSFWTAFVAQPLSRMQTGTTVLGDVPPGRRAGVLQALRRGIGSVNDWALGRHGPERAFIGTSALGYVVPFAIALGALAMVTACAQTLLFVLLLLGPFVLPFAVDGPRRRGDLIRYWLLPLFASVGLLAVASFASYVLLRIAQTLHATDVYLGLLLAGSIWPLTLVLVVRQRLRRRRRQAQATAALAAKGK
jgi:hypothetical protein